jgi:hypothetical protein
MSSIAQLRGVASENTTYNRSAFQFSLLQCHYPQRKLAKTILADLSEEKLKHCKTFIFRYKEFEYLENLASALDWLATRQDMCLIRGQLLPGLSGWQRRLIKPTKDGASATIECPPRRNIIFDLDDIPVPEGLGLPDKLVEAGTYIRSHLFPPMFQQTQCVASVTAKTGLRGPSVARLRLFFQLSAAVDNELLSLWMTSFSNEHPELKVDPSVMEPEHIIYTARPTFVGRTDPVPPECRVAFLDGPQGQIPVSWLGLLPTPEPKPETSVLVSEPVFLDEHVPDWLAEKSEADTGCGVVALWLNQKAAEAIKTIHAALQGCPPAVPQISPKGNGRHFTLNAAAYWMMKLVGEGELSVKEAADAYFSAASQMQQDSKYNGDYIQSHWDYVWSGS